MTSMLAALILLTMLVVSLLAPLVSFQCLAASHQTPGRNVPRDESPNAQAAPLTEPEFKRWLEEHATLLDQFEETLRESSTSRPMLARAKQRAEDALHKTLTVICRIYLGATPDQRELIRRMFDERETAISYLLSYPSYATEQIHSKKDAEWVLLGLAAASIQDNRVDFRDTYDSLGDLYIRSFRKGIAPGTYFRTVALLSSKVPSLDEQDSMYEFLLGFETSLFFKYDVAPKLRPRKGRPRPV